MLREQKLAVVGLTLLLVIPISFVFLIVLYEPTENYLSWNKAIWCKIESIRNNTMEVGILTRDISTSEIHHSVTFHDNIILYEEGEEIDCYYEYSNSYLDDISVEFSEVLGCKKYFGVFGMILGPIVLLPNFLIPLSIFIIYNKFLRKEKKFYPKKELIYSNPEASWTPLVDDDFVLVHGIYQFLDHNIEDKPHTILDIYQWRQNSYLKILKGSLAVLGLFCGYYAVGSYGVYLLAERIYCEGYLLNDVLWTLLGVFCYTASWYSLILAITLAFLLWKACYLNIYYIVAMNNYLLIFKRNLFSPGVSLINSVVVDNSNMVSADKLYASKKKIIFLLRCFPTVTVNAGPNNISTPAVSLARAEAISAWINATYGR